MAARLAADGVDAASAGAIITAILRRGWTFSLAGGPRPAFFAAILEPRFGAVWASADGDTPAAALGAVLAACLDAPPWGQIGDDAPDAEPP